MLTDKEVASQSYSGRIFKADQKGFAFKENNWTASCLTFENYFSESRKAFGSLLFLNDVKITAGGSAELGNAGENICHVLLPLVGTIVSGENEFTMPEEVRIIQGNKKKIKVSNLNARNGINFLHFGISSATGACSSLTQKFTLSKLNEMVSLRLENSGLSCHMYTGVFCGRAKSIYRAQKGNGIFVFVINGVFEVEERLLEHRDGLSLWDTEAVAFESLSENAILLLMEIPLNNQI